MTRSKPLTQNSKLKTQNSSQGNLLGLLTAAFYVLFTLLPDSNSAMVEWSWVLFWQVGLICPVLWLLGMLWRQRFHWLGDRLDWVAGLLLIGLIISTILAPYPMQARWYGWAVVCFLAALYAVNSWLTTSRQQVNLLIAQGYLSLALILVSLLLWSSQTLLPELSRLQELRQSGVNLAFDFANIGLRNGAPIGHQNYVAGYLVLTIPLLLGLGILQKGWQRWIWWTGVGLGLLDLYTTSSRGGWLGMALLAVIGFGVLLWRSQLPRRWVGLMGLAGFASLVLLALANNRLRSLITSIFTGQGGGELAYRLITVTTGWQMGLSHLFSGVGPGNVPLLFQKYRPIWAGREAELHYQLHSTPAQLWAEMGIWAILVAVQAIALLTWLSIRWLRSLKTHPSHTPPILIGCLLSSLTAYALVSLTDYQLDNISISGAIVVYLAVLATEFRNQEPVGEDAETRGHGDAGRLSQEDTETRRHGDAESLSQKDAETQEYGDAESLSQEEPGILQHENGKTEPADLPASPRLPLSASSPSPPPPPSPSPFPASPRLPLPVSSPSPVSSPTLLPLAGIGLLIAIILWLAPIHRAWMLADQGFVALSRKDINSFAQRLTQAHQLTPWEPYYPYQLGWNLGNLGLQTKDASQQEMLMQDGANWLKQGVQAAPDQEFGHTNLAWLLLNRDPKAASQSFARSAQLVPAKRGVFYGLGLSLLAQKQTNLAIASLTLEALRDPLLITSPVWKLPELQPLYEPVTRQMEAQYTAWLEKNQNSQPLTKQLHQSRGGLRWWVGNLAAAHADWDKDGLRLSRLVLDLAENKVIPLPSDSTTPAAGALAIAAWLNPNDRSNLLHQAWIIATQSEPDADLLRSLVDTMGRSSTFDQWLKQNAPTRQFRRERAGFGVLSRHADGPAPTDFLPVIANIPMTVFFDQFVQALPAEQIIPSFGYAPELDKALQPLREALLQKVFSL